MENRANKFKNPNRQHAKQNLKKGKMENFSRDRRLTEKMKTKQKRGFKRPMASNESSPKKFVKTGKNERIPAQTPVKHGYIVKTSTVHIEKSDVTSYLRSLEQLQKKHSVPSSNQISEVNLKVLEFTHSHREILDKEYQEIKNSTNAYEICNISNKFSILKGRLMIRFSDAEDATKVYSTGLFISGKRYNTAYPPGQVIVINTEENGKSLPADEKITKKEPAKNKTITKKVADDVDSDSEEEGYDDSDEEGDDDDNDSDEEGDDDNDSDEEGDDDDDNDGDEKDD